MGFTITYDNYMQWVSIDRKARDMVLLPDTVTSYLNRLFDGQTIPLDCSDTPANLYFGLTEYEMNEVFSDPDVLNKALESTDEELEELLAEQAIDRTYCGRAGTLIYLAD